MPQLNLTVGEIESAINKALEINDFIIESGEVDGWTYKKLKNGIIKLWAKINCVYKTENYLEGNKTLPFVNITELKGVATINLEDYSLGAANNNKSLEVYFSNTGVAVFCKNKTPFSSGYSQTVVLEAIGKWY